MRSPFTVLLTFVLALGCTGAGPSGTEAPAPADALAPAEAPAPAKGDAPASDERPDWQVTYAGAHQGEVGGTVAKVQRLKTSRTSVSIAGRSHSNRDVQLAGSYAYAGEAVGKHNFLSFSLKLSDELRCQQKPPEHMVVIEVTKDADKVLEGTFKGSLDCDGQALTVEGWFESR